MTIGILYESEEWSNLHLAQLIRAQDRVCKLVDVERTTVEHFSSTGFRLVVNRVFASSSIRGHHRAHGNTLRILEALDFTGIPVINGLPAFQVECSKSCYYERLHQAGFLIPAFEVLPSSEAPDEIIENLGLPLILKPDCGGRSFHTHLIQETHEIPRLIGEDPETTWLLQRYIEPSSDFTTRIEILGGRIMTVLKRFLSEDGISSYSRGSTLALYPECSPDIRTAALEALGILDVDMAGLDFIESEEGKAWLIDINATSNFTPDYIPLLGFDPIEAIANFILGRYQGL